MAINIFMDKELPNNKTYEIRVRIMNTEVFAVGLSSSSDSNRWIFIGMVTMFSLLTVVGAYGEKLVSFWQGLQVGS